MELHFAGASYLMKEGIKRRGLIIKSSSSSTSQGLQKCSKKNLSRILRTEAAIRGIHRKANSEKYTNLWPKAVLKALDDAIRDNRWDSALKVPFRMN